MVHKKCGGRFVRVEKSFADRNTTRKMYVCNRCGEKYTKYRRKKKA